MKEGCKEGCEKNCLLDLSWNKIEVLEIGLFGVDSAGQGGRCSSLRNLDLSHNNIFKFPQDALTGENIQLRFLDISFNRVTDIQNLDDHLFRYLAVLDSSHNHIQTVDLDELENLKSLDLSVNRIENFKTVTLSKLIEADIHRNLVSEIDTSQWASLESLYLSHNRLDHLGRL